MPSPEMAAIMDRYLERRAAARATPPPSLSEVRADYEQFPTPGGVPEGTFVEEIPGGYLLTPRAARDDGAVVYLHGGAYAIGSLQSHGDIATRIAAATGRTAVFVDYRRAPEHPYPAAVDDAVVAWDDAAQRFDPSRIALAGDSAGAGLALALALRLRAAARPGPSRIALLSPWADLSGGGETISSHADVDPILTPELLSAMADGYLQGADPGDPHVSPTRGDLHGLPPVLIQVGTAEILLGDSLALARCLALADVTVTLEVHAGLPHVFPRYTDTPEAIAAIDRIGVFLRR